VTDNTLLSVEDVSVNLPTPRGNLRAVDRVNLTVGAGQTLGVVGESGCGKTMLSRAILQLLPKKANLTGRVIFDGQDLTTLGAEPLRKLRGRSLAVVFQDPMTSLNPVLTIGSQLMETLQEHLELDASGARQRSLELLAAVGIPAFMRVARAATLTLTEREFIVAARALGATHTRILLRELLPNVLLPLLAFFLLGVAVTILVERALSFLGLGVPPPASSWGSMIGEGRERLEIAPRLSFIPAVTMFLTVLSFNLVGDTLRALTDPRQGAL